MRGLRRRVRALGLQNIAIGLDEPHDPRLPTNSLDIAILVHMYHEIAQPYASLYNLVSAPKPGARVGIATRDGKGPVPKLPRPSSRRVRRPGDGTLNLELSAAQAKPARMRKTRRPPTEAASKHYATTFN